MTHENRNKIMKKIIDQSILSIYCIVVWLLSGAGYFWPAWVILAACINIAAYTYKLGFWCEEHITEACSNFMQKCHTKYQTSTAAQSKVVDVKHEEHISEEKKSENTHKNSNKH